MARNDDHLINIIPKIYDIILIDNAILILIMDQIFLTCNITNIQFYAAHRKNWCKILLLCFVKPHMGNSPYLIVLSIYVIVSYSWPSDLESIRLCDMNVFSKSIQSSAQHPSLTIGYYPHLTSYNNPHHE